MTSQNLPIVEQRKQPLVSVIMNCYNSAHYLREALDSVLAQTFPDWEIIFWDNKSTDESAAIFKSYMDARFRYFLAAEHTTLGHARNLAVEQASGEWLAFLDCDDLWLPLKLEKQVSIIREEGGELGLVYGKCQILVDESGCQTYWGRRMEAFSKEKARRSLLEGNIFPSLLKWNFVPLLSAMVRRSTYWSVGGIDPAFTQAEDYDLFVKISRLYRARAVHEVICIYRIHGSNQSHRAIDICHQEALKIVGRYLPMVEAKKGMRYHRFSHAVGEARRGYVFKALTRLLLG